MEKELKQYEIDRNADGLNLEEFIEQYKPSNYERPSVTVDMVMIGMKEKLDGLKVLLIKRKNHPYINCWAFPGGFMDIDESSYEAACRELNEETGLPAVYMEQLYTLTSPERDPRMRIISIAYLALFNMEQLEDKVKAGDDAKEAKWFNIIRRKDRLKLISDDETVKIEYKLTRKAYKNGVVNVYDYEPELISTEQLAFDHAGLLITALNRLKSKVAYGDAAFNLVPKEFVLPDLQRIYEVILNKEYYRTSFKNEVKDKIKLTGTKTHSKVNGRLGNAYRYVRGDYFD